MWVFWKWGEPANAYVISLYFLKRFDLKDSDSDGYFLYLYNSAYPN